MEAIMKGFSSALTETVILNRSGEELRIELTALPPGYNAFIARVMPPPCLFVDGALTTEPDPARRPHYSDWRVYVRLAKALGDVLDARVPAPTAPPEAWYRYAMALQNEFEAANFTDAELTVVAQAMNDMNYDMEKVKEAGKASRQEAA
jgi:hypothetical protein